MSLTKEIIKFIAKKFDENISTNFYPALINRNSKTTDKNDYKVPDYIQYIFLHVPKTGGNTFNSILMKINQKKNIFWLGGHNPISILHNPDEKKYITIIRNPVDRVFSLYNTNLVDKKQSYNYLAKKGLSQFLQFCPDARNACCQYYSGYIGKEANDLIFNKAISNLAKFKFILNFEKLEDDIKKFCENIDFKIDEIPHHNTSTKKKIDQDQVKLIKFYNYYDLKLFEEVKTMLKKN